MAKFYFTYGTEGQPYSGGWSIVCAEDFEQACAVFKIKHPCISDGLLNCAAVYNEAAFNNTSMAKRGNFGSFCHEVITLTVEEVESRV